MDVTQGGARAVGIRADIVLYNSLGPGGSRSMIPSSASSTSETGAPWTRSSSMAASSSSCGRCSRPSEHGTLTYPSWLSGWPKSYREAKGKAGGDHEHHNHTIERPAPAGAL